jgi:hypothetical protein
MRTNDAVAVTVADANSLYIGGDFTAVNPYVASRMAVIDALTATPILACNLKRGFDAPVYVVLPVGNALYVGGEFTTYQGLPAQNLAKLNAATCALDRTFSQPLGFVGSLPARSSGVYTLAVNGSALYVGGSFTAYRNAPAMGLAKLDTQSGALDASFAQATGFNLAVTALAATSDAVFVGGFFSTYRGAQVGYPGTLPLKLNAQSGNIDPTFNQGPTINGLILSMTVSGGSLYVAGNFNKVVEKLDVLTGVPDPQFTQGGAGPQVNVVVLSGNTLYVGGAFSSYGGVPSHNIAKVDAITGAVDGAFSQAAVVSGVVSGIAIAGNSLYLAGAVPSSASAGNSSIGITRLNAATGAPDMAFASGPGIGGASTISVVGNSLYIGGFFGTYGGTPASHFAVFDVLSGVADANVLAQGGTDGPVSTLLLDNTSLYVGGAFAHYGTQPDLALAKIDSRTGALDTTFTQPTGLVRSGPVAGQVNALARSGSSLYVGGNFNSYRGQPAPSLVKVDALNGNIDTAFTQLSGFSNSTSATITALATSGTSLYVGGAFTSYRGVPAFNLAKLDALSGVRDPAFVPIGGLQFPTPIFTALLPVGNALFAAGTNTVYFGSSGTFISAVAKLDAGTGAADATFTQAIGLVGSSSFGPIVRSLALSGTSLYVAGDFERQQYGTNNYALYLAKFDATSGTFDTTFSLPLGPNNPVTSLCLANSNLYIGGLFTTYRNSAAGYLVPLDPVSGANRDP